MKSTQKRLLFICGGLIVSVLIFFIAAEILLRIAGYTPWKTQLNFPETQVKNWGVGGYGTLKTLLALKTISDKITNKTTVFYGLIEHPNFYNGMVSNA